EPIVGLVGAVTQDEAVLCQLLGDGENGVPQALVVMRKEFEAPRQQRRSVERIRLVVLAQHAPIADAVVRTSAWISSAVARHVAAIFGSPRISASLLARS